MMARLTKQGPVNDGRSKWLPLMMMPVTLMPVFTLLFRRHGADARWLWSVWQPILVDVMRVLLVVTLLAIVVAGVSAWRGARRDA